VALGTPLPSRPRSWRDGCGGKRGAVTLGCLGASRPRRPPAVTTPRHRSADRLRVTTRRRERGRNHGGLPLSPPPSPQQGSPSRVIPADAGCALRWVLFPGRGPSAWGGGLGRGGTGGRGRFSSPSALPWGGPSCSAGSSAGLPSSRKMRSYWREPSAGLRG